MWIDKYNSEGYYDPTTYQAMRMVLRDELKRRYGTGYRPLVFICSPFAGDIKANTERTKNYCRFAVEQYAIPVAPHLLYPQFMDEHDPDSRIKNGKAVIDKEAAEQIKTLFQSYLSGDSLATAAKKAGIKAFHSGIGRMLRNTRYLGDEFYPAIIDKDTFNTAEAERIIRLERLGRNRKPKQEKEVVYPTAFRMKEGIEEFDDPFGRAEYSYSLIETEVNKNGSK